MVITEKASLSKTYSHATAKSPTPHREAIIIKVNRRPGRKMLQNSADYIPQRLLAKLCHPRQTIDLVEKLLKALMQLKLLKANMTSLVCV